MISVNKIIKKEPLAFISIIISLILFIPTFGYQLLKDYQSQKETISFYCFDVNEDTKAHTQDQYIYFDVSCKVKNLSQKSIGVDTIEPTFFYNKESFPTSGYFDARKIPLSKLTEYFPEPFTLAPSEQRNISKIIAIPVEYGVDVNSCNTGQEPFQTTLFEIASCFDLKLQKPLANYIYEGVDVGLGTVNGVGLRLISTDGKEIDQKIKLYSLPYKLNEKIRWFSSDRNLEEGHIKIKNSENSYSIIDFRSVLFFYSLIVLLISICIFGIFFLRKRSS